MSRSAVPRTRDRSTPVVTVFLTSAGRIALFKRSESVGTYRGAWAGVSGYVERLPLQQALVELHEETGLGPGDVELRGIGVPVVVDDRALGRIWTVYPFLFHCRATRDINADWESESIEWVEPREIAERRTVPGLDRALASVWPPFGDAAFWSGLREVATDTVRSSTALAICGVDHLDAYLGRSPDAPPERAVKAFAACRPSMGIFPHLAAKLLSGRLSGSDVRKILMDATAASAEHAAEALAGRHRVLTTSYSSAVRETLLACSKTTAPFEVIATESRPGLEGVELARDLAKEGVGVTVITEAQIGLFADEVDAVLVGCDGIAESDMLHNKAGTSLLVTAARSAGVACYAVAQTFKIVPPGFAYGIEEQEPDAVGRVDGVRFRNLAFDAVPLRLFEAVLVEQGKLTPRALSAIRAQLSAAGLVS